MSFVSTDVDLLIASKLFDTSSKMNTKIIRKTYEVFSQYPLFLSKVRDAFFKTEFANHQVHSLEDLISKIVKKKRITQYREYQLFNKLKGESALTFDNVKKSGRIILSFMSLYHGYHYKYSNIKYKDGVGYIYSKKDKDMSLATVPHSFNELLRYNIHNPAYYNRTEDGKYLLRTDADIYRVGATTERLTVVCRKVF